MVGERGQCDADHKTEAVWQDAEYEYGRTFFSVDYAGRSDLFEKLDIWKDEKYRTMQGTYPVIALSFADIKDTTFSSARKSICYKIKKLYNKYDFLLKSDCLNDDEKEMFKKISPEMENYLAADSIRSLADYMERFYGKKVIILLDEYDTPMQEAYMHGYWSGSAFTNRRKTLCSIT